MLVASFILEIEKAVQDESKFRPEKSRKLQPFGLHRNSNQLNRAQLPTVYYSRIVLFYV
jgi:hypothetical protein